MLAADCLNLVRSSIFSIWKVFNTNLHIPFHSEYLLTHFGRLFFIICRFLWNPRGSCILVGQEMISIHYYNSSTLPVCLRMIYVSNYVALTSDWNLVSVYLFWMLLNSIGENENSLSNIVTQKRRSSVVYFFKLFIPSTRLDLLTLASHKK